MIVVMKQGADEDQIQHVVGRLEEVGVEAHVSKGKFKSIVLVIGDVEQAATLPLDAYPGVEKVVRILKPFKLVSREAHPENTVVSIRGVPVRDGAFTVMAGPCSVETESQLMESARKVKEAGAVILRGGAFKPRSSPYSFQGLGEEGLKILAAARDATGLPIVTEVMDPRDIEVIAKYADMLQIGARNMQNFLLLSEVGKTSMPVLLKRGFANTIEEWMMAAEYVLRDGNHQVVLCERGIRTFETSTRNTLDLSAIPVVRGLSHLPVIVDPSHATGRPDLVEPMTLAALAAGACGVMIEVHAQPEQAWCDGEQSLTGSVFADIMGKLPGLARACGVDLVTGPDE